MKTQNLLMVAIAVFGMATIASAQVPNYVPTNGLVGWWPFNGNANDESGNGNNGTVNGATLTTDRFGAVDKAYDFDGVDDYISTNYQGICGLGSRTISFWMKTNASSVMYPIIYGGDAVSTQSNAGTYFDCVFNYGGSGANADCGYTDISYHCTTPPDNGQWSYYVWILDSVPNPTTFDIKIYQNGILLDSIQSTFQPNIPLNTFCSLRTVKFGDIFTGQIDDIGIWNRALNQQEITALYNSTLGLPVSINGNSIKLYPNPTNGFVTLEVSIEKIGKSYSILDFSGRTIRDGKISSAQEQIDLEHVARGVYYLSIENGSSVIKLVKQ